MLAENLHDSPVWGQVVVNVDHGTNVAAILNLEDVAQPVGIELVWANQAKVCLRCVADEDIAKHLAQLTSGFVVLSGRSANVNRIFAKVGQVQVHQQPATVGMGVGAHASMSRRRQVRELVDQPSTLVE